MKNLVKSIFTCLTLCSLVMLSGCGGTTYTTGLVSGTVTLDGAPLPNATLIFTPQESGTPAAGTTDASGEYELIYSRTTKGAAPGSYTVSITTREEQAAKEIVPAKYNESTELKETVELGENAINFDLTTS